MSLDIFANAGQALLLTVLFTLLVGSFVRDTFRHKLVVVVLLAVCMLVPLHGLTVAQWLRSVVGDLSIIALVIFTNILIKRLFDIRILSPLSRQYLLRGVALVGVLLYPFALGFGSVDPYHFGYAPSWMSVLLILASIACWVTGMRDLAVVLLLPLLAFNLQILESVNLWDYVLDPVLFMYALAQSVTFLLTDRLKIKV